MTIRRASNIRHPGFPKAMDFPMFRAALWRCVVIGSMSMTAVADSPPNDDAARAVELLHDASAEPRQLVRIATTLSDPQHQRLAGDCFWRAAERHEVDDPVTFALRRTAWKRWLDSGSLSHASTMLDDWIGDPTGHADAERQLVTAALRSQRFELAVHHARRRAEDSPTVDDLLNLHWAITSSPQSSTADLLASIDGLHRFAADHPEHAASGSTRQKADRCVREQLRRMAAEDVQWDRSETETLWQFTVRFGVGTEAPFADHADQWKASDRFVRPWIQGVPDEVFAELADPQRVTAMAARHWAAQRIFDQRRFAELDEAFRRRPPDPTQRRLHAIWAESLTEIGRVEAALAIWRDLIDHGGDVSVPLRWRLRLAECEVAAGDSSSRAATAIDAAAAAVNAAGNRVDGDGTLAMLSLLRGQLAIRRADLNESLTHFENVVAHPASTIRLKMRAQFLIGECLLMQRRFADAIDAYRTAIELAGAGRGSASDESVDLHVSGGSNTRDDVTPLAWLQTGKAHQSLGRTRQAAICYTRVIDVYQEHACAAEASARLASLRRPPDANVPAASHR